jgi:hypothetical protein
VDAFEAKRFFMEECGVIVERKDRLLMLALGWALVTGLSASGAATSSAPRSGTETSGAIHVLTDEYTENIVFDAPSDLHVITSNAPIAVSAWDGGGIRMTVRKAVRGTDEDEMRGYATRVRVLMSRPEGRLALFVFRPVRPAAVQSVEVGLDLAVPRDMVTAVVARTSGAPITLQGLNANISALTSNGEITVVDCAGEIEVATSFAPVTLHRTRFLGGSGLAATSNAPIHADVAFADAGSFRFITSNAPVDLEISPESRARVAIRTRGSEAEAWVEVAHAFRPHVVFAMRTAANIVLEGGGANVTVRTSNALIRIGPASPF